MTGPGWTARLRSLATLALAVGVTCQFVQRTDPTPTLSYFTVDSAVLAAVVLAWRLVRGPRSGMLGDRIRCAAVVGVVLSSLVYVAVIAPSSPSGTWFGAHDDVWTRAATILLHAVAPVLVVADFLVSPYAPAATLREAALLALWPLAYLAVVAVLAWSGAATMPYRFLSPSQFGAAAVAAAIAVLCAITVLLGVALPAARGLVRRPPAL